MSKRRISKYEEFFIVSDVFAECMLCGKGVKRQQDGGTNTMRNHLNVHHKAAYIKFLADEKPKERKFEHVAAVQAQSSRLQQYTYSQSEIVFAPEIKSEDFDARPSTSFDLTDSDVDSGGISAESLLLGQAEEIAPKKDKLKVLEGRMSIAVVQAGTVIYNTPATLDKLEQLVEEAAGKGAKLILFPEGFVGGYPKWNDFGIVLGTRSPAGRAEYRQYFDSSIPEHGSESKRMAEVAAKFNVHLIVGVIERDGATLYCSMFFYSPEKYLGKHRKLMPTALERCVWGCGDGSTMPVFETELGVMGAAICWENYMPLYRVNLYSKGIQLYLAPTVDDREVWLSTMRTIAIEGRCFVLSACQFLKAGDYPKGHALREEHGDEKVLIRGGSCAVDPLGNVLIEPNFSGEMIRYVDVDLATITRGKFDLDTVGHYARPDIFQLHVNEQPQKGIIRH